MDTITTLAAAAIVVAGALLAPVMLAVKIALLAWRFREHRERREERAERLADLAERREERAERQKERHGVCPVCEAPTRIGARYCAKCGADLSKKVCSYCGNRPAAGARFCGRCGREQPVIYRPTSLPDGSYLLADGTIYGDIPF